MRKPVALRLFARAPRRAHPKDGTEPDPRLKFANERTFLAWVRAGLALIGGGLVAAQALQFELGGLRLLVAGPPIALGGLVAVASYWRWHVNERAMRMGKPPHDSPLPAILIVGIMAVAAILSLLVLLAAVTGVAVERTTAVG
jgi:inner membrane protein YidH